jgi:hypothetical protein
LAAVPESPEREVALALAPEFAALSALPIAVAGPVFPESPEFPLLALPPVTTAVPRIAVLVAVTFDVALPVRPVSPESPEMATGFEVAEDVALPVFPVLVALDCALAAAGVLPRGAMEWSVICVAAILLWWLFVYTVVMRRSPLYALAFPLGAGALLVIGLRPSRPLPPAPTSGEADVLDIRVERPPPAAAPGTQPPGGGTPWA